MTSTSIAAGPTLDGVGPAPASVAGWTYGPAFAVPVARAARGPAPQTY
ncbi:hypothetical protein RIF23_04495 [Lipingzhangella sp. LS1_29]|uniref:Uncharacterized protein n=1 Tax=Lipingzhangella rawalii TaxID=2055835 RepID=A0ABU2H400_9ACTN|nr:hypothetical protein [Lipingzhangella rawalii]